MKKENEKLKTHQALMKAMKLGLIDEVTEAVIKRLSATLRDFVGEETGVEDPAGKFRETIANAERLLTKQGGVNNSPNLNMSTPYGTPNSQSDICQQNCPEFAQFDETGLGAFQDIEQPPEISIVTERQIEGSGEENLAGLSDAIKDCDAEIGGFDITQSPIYEFFSAGWKNLKNLCHWHC